MKKISLNAMAAMAMGLAVVSCSHDLDGYMPSSEEQLANATDKLGVEIDPNQDWNMTGTVSATVSVNLGLDQNYTVGIYDANPLFGEDVHFYAKKGIAEGGSVNMSFEAPSAANTFYVAVFDSKSRYLVQAAPVVDGAMNVTFGTTVSGARRATEAEYADTYAKTLDDFLNVSGELNPYNQTVNAISVSDFANYTLLTNDLIVNEAANRTLTNNSWMAGLNGAFPGHGDGKHYRVAAGEEVTEVFHINGDYGKWNDAVIYVEGTLHLNGNTLNGPTLVVANGGKIVVDGTTNMSNAGRIVVMAGGSIEGKNGVAFNVNNGAPSYNAGTINFNGELNINGSIFYNCGTVNVDVLRNTSGGVITNFGHVTARTNMNAGDTYNCTFVNGCYMHYTENAGIGQLTMLKNSRLDVDGVCEFNQSWNGWELNATTPENTLTFVPNNPNILMDKSVINVGTAYVTNTVFKGPSSADEIAIVKMGKVQAANGIDLMQRDNCYFDWDITELYNKQGEKYQDIPAADKVYNKYGYLVDFYRGHVTKFITEASSPVSIPTAVSKDDCTGAGYNPKAETVAPKERPAVWSYAFEDTPLGDYDMNDVVIKVSYHYDEVAKKADESKLDVTLCCTGATLELKVYLNETALFGGEEVHKALGRTAPELVNTGAGPDAGTNTVTINKPANFDFGTADFWISSPRVPGGVHIAKQGQDPHGIVIPADWAWPTEYTCIKDAYPSFIDFAKDASVKSEWYKETPVSGKTYKK